MWKSLFLSLSSLLILLPAVAQRRDYEPFFEIDDCPFPLPGGETEGETIVCGYLIVPEIRGQADSEVVALATAILHSTGMNPAPDPLVYLAGGPGGSALLEVELWVRSPFRARRDIILIDQRGTGYSFPTLDCHEVYGSSEDPERICYERLARAGIDLSAYHSAASAADIADLRWALQQEAINLYGVSYGTRLALTILRDYPDGIRSVILDSVYPPHINGLEEQTLHGANAILRLFDVCAADPVCAEAYGDLEATFYRVIDELNDESFPTSDPETGAVTDADGRYVVNRLFETLYSTEAIATLPYAVYLMGAGDYGFGLEVLAGTYTLDDLRTLAAGDELPEPDLPELPEDAPDGDSEGMYLSVECYEEVPFNSLEAAGALAADLPPQLAAVFLADVEQQMTACSLWDNGRAGALENAPVVSDVPVLVLAGGFDPITPPVWGQAAAEYLSRSFYVELPYAGHTVLDAGECPASIALAFLDDPLAAPDANCAEAMRLEFFVPEACIITPLATAEVYAGPDMDAVITGLIEPHQTYRADAYASDGDYHWLRIAAADNRWVREDVVDFPTDCFMLPMIEE